jgi:hypothetical protein
MSELLNALTGILAEIGYIILAVSAVGFVLTLIGSLLSFTDPDPHPHPTEEQPMATGTVTKIIWNNQLEDGEVRDNQTQELIPVPFSAVAGRKYKAQMPLQPGAQIEYEVFFNPGKTATNIRPLE